MNKLMFLARNNKPSRVMSVVCTGLKGYIYVECMDEAAVRNLCQGIRILRTYQMKMVRVGGCGCVCACSIHLLRT